VIKHMMIQYSSEWWEARIGKPSASEFDKIITPGGRPSKGQDGYIAQLIGDMHHFDPNAMTERPMNAAMRHGVDCEPRARAWYAMETGCDPQQVGGVQDDAGRFWSSPDFIVGDEGIGELKCPTPKTQVEYLLAGTLPDEYRPQVHAHLFISGRKWCDFVSYADMLPKLRIRVFPDDYTKELRVQAEVFYAKFQAALASIKGM
jgi:YqaJ-like viral recombinase domain